MGRIIAFILGIIIGSCCIFAIFSAGKLERYREFAENYCAGQGMTFKTGVNDFCTDKDGKVYFVDQDTIRNYLRNSHLVEFK